MLSLAVFGKNGWNVSSMLASILHCESLDQHTNRTLLIAESTESTYASLRCLNWQRELRFSDVAAQHVGLQMQKG